MENNASNSIESIEYVGDGDYSAKSFTFRFNRYVAFLQNEDTGDFGFTNINSNYMPFFKSGTPYKIKCDLSMSTKTITFDSMSNINLNGIRYTIYGF